MAIASIVTESVQIPQQDKTQPDLAIDAYLATPQESGQQESAQQEQTQYPGVIVIQEIFGVNDHIKDVTERLAQQGYVAIAPAIYQRQAPGFAIGYTDEEVAQGRKYKTATKTTELLGDIQATINYLYQLPQVKKTGVGTIGFCFGGHVVYLAATLKDVVATASFYGAQIATWAPGENEPTITRTKNIRGSIYTFFGNNDALIPNEQVDQIEAELKQQKVKHQVFRYENAGHGFFCDRRDSYNQNAAEDAWQKTLNLFSQNL